MFDWLDMKWQLMSTFVPYCIENNSSFHIFQKHFLHSFWCCMFFSISTIQLYMWHNGNFNSFTTKCSTDRNNINFRPFWIIDRFSVPKRNINILTNLIHFSYLIIFNVFHSCALGEKNIHFFLKKIKFHFSRSNFFWLKCLFTPEKLLRSWTFLSSVNCKIIVHFSSWKYSKSEIAREV